MIRNDIENKNSSDIKLSIGIPTYNGADYIRDTINSIIIQLEAINEKVEIVVSDNASIDDLYKIIQECQKKHPNLISYNRNCRNIGFDRNCDLVVRKSRGEFVWLLSDTDKIVEGGIKKVLEVINKHPYIAAIFVNYYNGINLNCTQDGLCLGGNDFFYKSSFKSGLMSSNIVRKNIWENIDVSKYFDTFWIHVGVLTEVLSNRQGYIITPYLVTQGHLKTPRWGHDGTNLNVGFEFIKIIKNMSKYGYREDVIKKGVYAIEGGYYIVIPFAKSHGLKVNLGFIKEFYKLHNNLSFWLIYLPLLLIPRQFYNYRVLEFLYKKFIKKHRNEK